MIEKFLGALGAMHDAIARHMSAIAPADYPLLAARARQEGHNDIACLTVPITTRLPSSRRKQTTYALHLGFPPACEDAIELYTANLCTVMAAAMHQLTGWPLALTTDPGWHVGVLPTVGLFMDIKGTHPIDDATVQRFDTLREAATATGLSTSWQGIGYSPCVEAVDPRAWALFAETTLYLAEAVIRTHGFTPDQTPGLNRQTPEGKHS